MLNELIWFALKSALENPEVKEKLGIKNNLMKHQNKIIDIDKNSYKVME